MLKNIIGLLAGLLFGLGLLISGMTDPVKVQGFLDVFGAWDISLALVMGGALAVALVGVQLLAKHRETSWVGTKIDMPTKTKITKKLIIGAILFGMGWGLVGICPGPGIVLLGTGQWQAYVFVSAMMIGMLVFQQLEPRLG